MSDDGTAYEARGFVDQVGRSRHPEMDNLLGAITKQEVILVLDCDATNVQAIAVDRQGKIVVRTTAPNVSDIAAGNSAWYQWSLEAIP